MRAKQKERAPGGRPSAQEVLEGLPRYSDYRKAIRRIRAEISDIRAVNSLLRVARRLQALSERLSR